MFIFDKLPPSPEQALIEKGGAAFSLWCKVLGLEMQGGGLELAADWEISNRRNPILRQTQKPFRPTRSKDMQQVRVEVRREVRDDFKYLFDLKPTWRPVFEGESLASSHNDEGVQNGPAKEQWSLVRGLESSDKKRLGYAAALVEASPKAGNFVLLAPRRVKLLKENAGSEDDEFEG